MPASPRQIASGFLSLAQQAEKHIAKTFGEMTAADIQDAIDILSEQRRTERRGNHYLKSSVPFAIFILARYRDLILVKKGH